ncbi:hypothetical protein D3C79_957680 [compost metagenome]
MVGHDHALADVRVTGDGVLDFRQLDAMATDFYLAVTAPQKTGAAIGQVGTQVTGAITAVIGGTSEWVDDELGLGQRRVAPVTLRQIGAADEDFTGFAHADQLVGRVDHQQLRIGDTFAQGHP